MDFWHTLFELIALLGSAIVLGALFERLRLSALSGYLLAGVMLGPGGFNLIGSSGVVHALAEMGIALLLFTIGLEFSLRRLRQLGPVPLFGGLLQIGLTALAVTGLCLLAGLPITISAAIGVMAAPSSTAVVLRVLQTDRGLESIHGRTSLGILLLQDAALVPMVLVVSALGSQEPGESALLAFGQSLLMAAGLIAVFYVIITWVFPFLLHATSRVASREPFIMLAVVTCFLATWSAHALGLSPALGAFIAGMLLADQPFATQVRADVGALRVLFVTLFFASVGMLADVRWLADNILVVLGITLATYLLKTVLVTAILLIFRQPLRHAIAAGIILGMVGEFSFLLAEVARTSGLLSAEMSAYVLSVTVISLFISPLVVKAAGGIGIAIEKALPGQSPRLKSAAKAKRAEGRDRIIVIGLGPAGMRVLTRLLQENRLVTGVDLNADLVTAARRHGVEAHIGDAANPDILDHLHAREAAAIAVTVPDPTTARAIIIHVRRHCPNVPLIARSRWDRYHHEIVDAGADETINEEELVGETLGQAVIRRLEGNA